MNKQYQLEKQRKLSRQYTDDDDDEQVEKTLNFFDSILDQYLTEQDVVPNYEVEKSSAQEKKLNASADPRPKQGFNVGLSNYTSMSSSSSSASSSSRDTARASSPAQNLRPPVAPTSQVRRFTSENSLNQIVSSSSSSRPLNTQNSSQSRLVKTTATSTEDLSTIPSWKDSSPLVRRSNLDNGTSASLIDLTSIGKVSSRPRFRFVPPSSQNLALKEEPEPEPDQQTFVKNEQFHLKTITTDRTSHQNKVSHKIIKPTVIIPPVPKTAPVIRLTETNIHYPTGHSAFKPHQSGKPGLSPKISQATKPNAQVGSTTTNSNERRQQQTVPQFHQSMLNLSSAGIADTANTNIVGARTSFQPSSSHLIKPIPHSIQSNKPNGYHQYAPSLSHQPAREDPISRWIEQVNNSSSISGLVHQSHTSKGGNRSHQPAHAYASHISTSSGNTTAPTTSNHHHRPPAYFNPVNLHKYHSPQHSAPVQSTYHASPAVSRADHFPSSSNVYHFNQTNSPRERQLRRNPHRPHASITTYL